MLNEVLEEFREFLNSCSYAQVIEILTSGKISKEPWAKGPVSTINNLPSPVSELVKLCHLGEPVERPENIFGERLLGRLVGINFLKQDENKLWSMSGKCIIPYQGLYVLSEQWHPGLDNKPDQVWFGDDSVFLARCLPAVSNRKVLDLCTGTGIHGMLMASRGNNVSAVDINPCAVEFAKMNSVLNGLDKTMKIYEGNLFEPVKGEKFDLIVSNPPFLPIPKDTGNGYLFAEAGYTGMEILINLLDNLQEFLYEDGCAIIIAGGFGNSEEPEIMDYLRENSKKKGWNTNLTVITRNPANTELQRLGRQFPQMAGSLMDTSGCLSPEQTHYHSFIITVSNGSKEGHVRFLPCSVSFGDQLKELRNRKQ